MRLDLVKELYFRELDGKAEFDRRLGVYVALLSGMASALAVLARYAWPGRGALQCAALAIVGVAAVLLSLAMIWAFLATVGYTYMKVPKAAVLLNYSNGLATYYQELAAIRPSESDNAVPAITAESEFEDYLIRHLSDAASRNSDNNYRRSARFYTSMLLLLWTFGLGLLSAALLLGELVVQRLSGGS